MNDKEQIEYLLEIINILEKENKELKEILKKISN